MGGGGVRGSVKKRGGEGEMGERGGGEGEREREEGGKLCLDEEEGKGGLRKH
jgi:hypothetical protein